MSLVSELRLQTLTDTFRYLSFSKQLKLCTNDAAVTVAAKPPRLAVSPMLRLLTSLMRRTVGA